MAERELPCCEQCYYCDAPLVRRHEHDHFPIPQSRGGEQVVPACINCHEMKDRMPIYQWNPSFFMEGLIELIGDRPQLAMSAPAVIAFVGDHRARWPRLSHAGRLTYAKTRFMVELGKPKQQDAADRPESGPEDPIAQGSLF